MLDFCISMEGTEAQVIAALQTLGFDDFIGEDELGNSIIAGNDKVAIDVWENPLLVRATYESDGVTEITPPVFASTVYLRIRVVDPQLITDTQQQIIDNAGSLPASISVVVSPTTRIWFGD